MDLITIKYDGIDAKRTDNVVIKTVDADLKLQKIEAKKEVNLVRVHFVYSLKFDPKVGHMNLSGYVIMGGEPEEISDVVSSWKKNKKLPKDLGNAVVAMIAASATTASVFTGNVMELPPPFLPPKLKVK